MCTNEGALAHLRIILQTIYLPIIYIYIYIYIYTLVVPGHALLWLSLFKWKKKRRKCMFLICLIFQYLDNKYIKTLLNLNKILSENFKPISGIKLEIIS